MYRVGDMSRTSADTVHSALLNFPVTSRSELYSARGVSGSVAHQLRRVLIVDFAATAVGATGRLVGVALHLAAGLDFDRSQQERRHVIPEADDRIVFIVRPMSPMVGAGGF